MINLMYTIIDEQHNKITEDEIMITEANEFYDLHNWFKQYDTEPGKTIAVVTMEIGDEDIDGYVDPIITFVLHGSIKAIAGMIKRKFRRSINKPISKYLDFGDTNNN